MFCTNNIVSDNILPNKMSTKAKIQNQALVIFGASGDLTYRKLLPAVFDSFVQKSLPQNFAVLGVARSAMTDEAFRAKMKDGIRQFASLRDSNERLIDDFLASVYYLAMDTTTGTDYGKLKERLQQLDNENGVEGNYIFYLSTPPSLYPKVPTFLAEQGLNRDGDKIRRIVIEKPFGTDLQSAIDLNKQLFEHYDEEQIYRIDHYLGKETVQNILVTRFANGIYEPLWNRNYIQRIEITAAESIGVENRGKYYDESGALRDMIQNHLLQLLAVVAMEPPMSLDAAAIRNEKLKIFQAIRPYNDSELITNVIRGQYTEANVKGKYMRKYRDEADVAPESRTETYVAMKLFIDNWRWAGVPFYIRTGKRMPTRVSEVVIHFKPTPQTLFIDNDDYRNTGNQLILRIQPNEGILLKTGMKVPGKGFNVKNVNLDFLYSSLHETYLPDAYERLLLDCMMGDASLYTRADALEHTWRFVQPILDFWKNNPDAPLYGYPAGTWGPECADRLIEGENQAWRNPCKNLSDDGNYCEL